MAERLADRAPWEFAERVMSRLEAPVSPDKVDEETGEFVPGKKMWERGMRLAPAQEQVFRCDARFKLDAGGVRSGKSLRGALELLVDILWRVGERGIKTDLWGVVAIDYKQSRETIRHLSRMLGQLEIPHNVNMPENQSSRVTFPAWPEMEVVTLSASDESKIAGRPYRGIVITEANQCRLLAWEQSRMRVSETRGWVYMEGTFEVQTKGPWYAQKWEEWQKPGAMGVSFSTPTWENTILFPGGRDDPEIRSVERDLDPLVFLEKYGGRPSKRSDSTMRYADERIHVAHRYAGLRQSYDPERPVVLFSDPGTAHAYAVLAVQFWAGEKLDEPLWYGREHQLNVCWVIDAVYRWGRTAQEIVQECAAKPWAAQTQTVVMDVAARQRRAEGAPVVEQWAEHWRKETGQRIDVITQPVPLAAGYDIHRRALLNSVPEDIAQERWNRDGRLRDFTDPGGPRLMFSPEAAAPLFGGMVDGVHYAGEYNLHRNKKAPDGSVISDEPVDRDNDAIKALNYGLYWWFGAAGAKNSWGGAMASEWELVVR